MARVPIRFHIGTQKAGSSYLYKLLDAQPAVAMSERAEVSFFSTYYQEGMEWYKGTFPDGGEAIDLSPAYVKFNGLVPARIAETVPPADARFSLFLRNPIDYVASHFHMHKLQGFFAKRPDEYPEVPESLGDFLAMYPAYAARGRYHELLSTGWLEHFDISQFSITPFERFTRAPHATLEELLAFFGIEYDPDAVPEKQLVVTNKALRFPWAYRMRATLTNFPRVKRALKNSRAFGYVHERFLTTKSGKTLTDGERAQLAALFADDVARLKMLTGYDFPEWTDFS